MMPRTLAAGNRPSAISRRTVRARQLYRAERVELSDRDRRIHSFEQQSPQSTEFRQLQQDLVTARKRVDDLLAESSRRTQQDDEVVATALRERARVERLTEVVGQTTRERDEAFHRATELEQRLGQVLAESDRLRGELSRVSGELPPQILPSEVSAKTEAPSHSEEARRTPTLHPSTAQRVRQVQLPSKAWQSAITPDVLQIGRAHV